MSGTITATYQATYPPRYSISLSGALAGIKNIYRVQGSVKKVVRGAGAFFGTGGFVFLDAEIPFGTPFTYQYTENGTTVSTIGPYTVALPGGLVALSDAISGAAAEVTLTAMDTRESAVSVSVFNVDGKNRIVSGKAGQFTSTYEYLTFSTSSAENLDALLKQATQGIVQQRQPGGYDRTDDYLAVTGYRETRFSQDGSDPRRLWSIDVAQTDGWSVTLKTRGFTYANVATKYTGLTYANWAADYPTYLAAASGDYS